MEITPEDRLLFSAQNNLLRWRFAVSQAIRRKDAKAFLNAAAHRDWWQEQVARLLDREAA